MEENNVQGTDMQSPAAGNFGGHPSQAHADHAAIMHAHGIISDPHRMNAVHALHSQGGGLMEFLKKKQKDFSTAAAQQKAAPGEKPASGPSSDASTDGAADGGKAYAGTES